MKMALECEDDDVVEDSLSGSSNDSDLVSKWNTKVFIWKYFGFKPNEKGKSTIKKSSKMLPLSTINYCEGWKHFKFI